MKSEAEKKAIKIMTMSQHPNFSSFLETALELMNAGAESSGKHFANNTELDLLIEIIKAELDQGNQDPMP